MGRLGAALDMMNLFRGFGTEQSTILYAMAHDLTGALIPTSLGLALAILSLWGHRYLTGKLARLVSPAIKQKLVKLLCSRQALLPPPRRNPATQE